MTGQAIFWRYMLLNLTQIVYCNIVTARNQKQVNIDNVKKNDGQVSHGYKIGNLVYVENTGIYQKLYYKKQGPCRIT